MKEFLSVLCLLICGILVFSFFSARTVASTGSTSLNLYPTTPQTMKCVGTNNTVSTSTSQTYQLVISCSDNAVGTSQPIQGGNFSNNTSQLCSQFGNNYVNIGQGVTWAGQAVGCNGGSWPNSWSCDSCCTNYSEVCYIQCAPIAVTAPVTNCTWQ